MASVEIQLPHHRYEVVIEPGLLSRLGEQVRDVAPHEQATLIVDEQIASGHGRVAARSLENAGYATRVAEMPPGEEHKTLGTVRSLYEVMLEAKMERQSPVVALGGGITGDTAGFVAATYLRGVPFVQCPTTLLAMVDASVGGKVGVNVPQGKNLIGAFYQPMRVVIDPETLRTLPDRELRCGLAECVKHGVIRDGELFDWLGGHLEAIQRLDSAAMVELVERNVRIKAAVVMEDEKEAGVRAHLNFGHTFAHAIEAADYGRYHHGEAVAIGMVAATRLAVDAGLCEAGLLARLTRLLEAIGLPVRGEELPPAEKLLETMRLDKKVQGAKIRLVLPEKMGRVVVTDEQPEEAILAAWRAVGAG
ncbi:MAG: 3-dehydroquinate synthase [Phycisphaeraceae bacterium]